jgi:hypothetical protein
VGNTLRSPPFWHPIPVADRGTKKTNMKPNLKKHIEAMKYREEEYRRLEDEARLKRMIIMDKRLSLEDFINQKQKEEDEFTGASNP